MPQAESLAVEGRNQEGYALILSVFPEATRSVEESLVLGNVLFKAHPEQSYDFHRQAAAQLSRYPNALLEWALEQHRAKKYAGASETYAAYCKAVPDYAPVWGLAAECAMRTGKLTEAVSLWKASEKARRGTIEQLESLVCEVNGRLPHESVRTDLLRRAEKRNEPAARELLLLDSDWEEDWWNKQPRPSRLEHDLATIRSVFPNANASLQPALCVAECELLQDKSGTRAVLMRYHYLIDADATLPEDGKALSYLIQLAMDARIFSLAEAKGRFGERTLAMARKSGDPELYNLAAYLAIGSDRLPEIDQEAWDRTKDVRFAASRIVGLAGVETFTLENQLLQRALKEFPENSEIAAVAVRLAGSDPEILRPYLVNAIKAEYTKFSSARPGVDAPRPSAYRLRQYFVLLEQCLSK